jgi:protein-disulfide isomerase
MMKRTGSTVLDVATAVIAIAAASLALRAYLSSSAPPMALFAIEPRYVANWDSYAAVGHRTGAQEPLLTILEFGDYECRPCRRLHPVITSFVDEFPEEVAFVYRHWPLEQHAHSFVAARAAECAGLQGRFWEYHDLLFSDPYWLDDAFSQFAQQAGVDDLDGFRQCLRQTDMDHLLHADVAAARELGGRGTPVLMINGTLWGRPPSEAELHDLLAAARLGRDGGK